MAVRALYESFAGNRGLYGREPSAVDAMSPAQIAAYLRSHRHSANVGRGFSLFETDDTSPPLTQGARASAPAVTEDGGDDDIEQSILDILTGDGTDQQKAARIAALLSGDDDEDDDLEESCPPKMHESASPGRAIHESAGQMIRRFRGAQRRESARMAAVGWPMG